MSTELTEAPNVDAVRPTGMCGSSTVCNECPSTFICSIKAGEEKRLIDARRDEDCASCGESMPWNECPKSERPCGHHCNHSWTHDGCDWCHAEFGEDSVKATS